MTNATDYRAMDNSDTSVIEQDLTSENEQCYLRVNSGRSAAQVFSLPVGKTLLCGSNIKNDVAFPTGSEQQEWQLKLLNEESIIRLNVIQGAVEMIDLPLSVNGEYVIVEDTTINAEGIEISLVLAKKAVGEIAVENSIRKTEGINLPPPGKPITEKQGIAKVGLYGVSTFCVLLGVLSAMYAVTGSLILVNADTNVSESNFIEAIETSDLSHLQIEQIEKSNRFIVDGAVDTREEKNLLKRIAEASNAELVVNVRVNDEVAESVEDIFRVNGVQADAEVLSDGVVNIHTRTSDALKLEDLRKKIRRDLPTIAQFEIVNTEPVVEPVKAEGNFVPKPEKRITLISAGENAYIMTQDKSRYFIGGLLPSGHLVEAINEGEVLVSKNGKKDVLKY